LILRGPILIGAVCFGLSGVVSAPVPSSTLRRPPSSLGVAVRAAAFLPAPSLSSDTPVLAELLTDLDAATAKHGDPVTAKVVEDLKSGRDVLLQKGFILKGHVIGAKTFSSDNPKSVVAILFDPISLSVGERHSAAIAIQAVAPAEGTRTEAELNPSIHTHDVKATVGYLSHKSSGTYGMPGVSLGYEVTKEGKASVVTSITGNVRLRKGMQVVITATE
jgi:hypothetical protein